MSYSSSYTHVLAFKQKKGEPKEPPPDEESDDLNTPMKALRQSAQTRDKDSEGSLPLRSHPSALKSVFLFTSLENSPPFWYSLMRNIVT